MRKCLNRIGRELQDPKKIIKLALIFIVFPIVLIAMFKIVKFFIDKFLVKEDSMGKVETVEAQKAVVLGAQEQALVDGLGACYDQGAIDQKGMDGTLNQEDLDKAVSEALAASKIITDQFLADSLAAQKAADDLALQTEHDASVLALQAVQKALEDMTAKEQLAEQAVADVKLKIDQVQEAFDKIKALFSTPV